jgi:hypothetical protein
VKKRYQIAISVKVLLVIFHSIKPNCSCFWHDFLRVALVLPEAAAAAVGLTAAESGEEKKKK